MPRRWSSLAVVVAILGLVGAIYWPVQHGAFVWDDIVCLRDQAWFRQNDAWKIFLFHDFCGVSNYFRPAAVALFLLEVRIFDVNPAPMHVVSLLIHIANTLLVGFLAVATFPTRDARGRKLVYLSMLLYGLHPALVEPVAWISAQTELIVTFFMLLGMQLNAILSRPTTRALAVSTCFFVAACAKESAVAFPLALVLFDWMRMPVPALARNAELHSLWRRQWQTYMGILAAGVAYLVLRHHALGYVLRAVDHSFLPPFARLQEACLSYLAYWRMLVWPMIGMGPVHFVDEQQFANVSALSLLADIAAPVIAICGGIAWWKRKAFGGLVVVVTALLLPVLHIVPVTFDESLYHDRYAMAPLAFAAAMLPGALLGIIQSGVATRKWLGGAIALALLWLTLAIVNIRVTLPLWGNDIALWQWALHSNPDSVSARENLFAAYVDQNDARTMAYAQTMIADPRPCAVCMLSVARFAIHVRAAPLAASALQRLSDNEELQHDAHLKYAFVVLNGDLATLNGDDTGAEAAYRLAANNNPRESLAQARRALSLARIGKSEEARRVEQTALTLLPADERAEQEQAFEQALATAAAAH